MDENRRQPGNIKCVVWDLDGTIWDGILLEGDRVVLKSGVKEVIQTLDRRGIVHSVASKNHRDDAMGKLREFGLDEYFLYPEINWNAKSASIRSIQRNLNIDIDAIMFVDDSPLERDEVGGEHPEVVCVDASEYRDLPTYPSLNPRLVTEDSARRRLMYLAEMQRKKDQLEYQGPKKEFLASLNMRLTISEATEDDLRRAEELTIRTNQLNTTGRTYSYEDLKGFMSSPKHRLLISDLEDKYGAYGKIGLALIEELADSIRLRLLLISCRVMSLGVGTVLLSYIMKEARRAGKKVTADFRDTGRNRMMHITFKFANFRQIGSSPSGDVVFENDLSMVQEFPRYMHVAIGRR